MIAFIIRRVLQSVLVMVAVAFFAFLMFNYVGDPVQNMVGPNASMAERDVMRQQLGLNDPAAVQFARFVGQIATGHFGVSYRLGRSVDDLIADRLPATLELVFVATVLALVVGIAMGIQSGIAPKSWISRLAQGVSLVGVSLPTFFIGIALMMVFSVWLRWFPVFGRGEVVQLGRWSTGFLTASGLKSLVLPAVTLSLFQMTLIMRLVRGELMEVMRADYIRFARARGLPRRLIHFVYALKNTLVPVITVIGLQIGSLIAFSIITETVFQWPGLGLMFVDAVQYADIPVMSTYLLLVALLFVAINLVVDILYSVIDPRLRHARPLAVRAA